MKKLRMYLLTLTGEEQLIWHSWINSEKGSTCLVVLAMAVAIKF